MNRRFFHRVDIQANGELLWATKSRFGRVSNHRDFITTVNVSMDGAKIVLKGRHTFPPNARARLKLGIEFCEVEVLEVLHKSRPDSTQLRLLFISPNARFVSVVEKWMPIDAQGRDEFISAWT